MMMISAATQTRREHHAAAAVQDGLALGRDAGGDAGEDQQRHAVADAALGDQLAHPHHQRRAGGHHQHDDDQGEDVELVWSWMMSRRAALQQPAVGGQRHDAGGLQDGQRDRQVAGVLRHLGLAGLAFLAQLLEPRDHHGQQLHDDAGGDVGHDADREHRQLQQRATGEQVDQRVDLRRVAAADLLDALLHVRVVDAGRRYRGTDPVEDDDAQGEQDLAPQVGCPQRRDESREHSSSCAAEPHDRGVQWGWSDQRLVKSCAIAPAGSQPAESRVKQSTRVTVAGQLPASAGLTDDFQVGSVQSVASRYIS